jgi:hypothetical protein
MSSAATMALSAPPGSLMTSRQVVRAGEHREALRTRQLAGHTSPIGRWQSVTSAGECASGLAAVTASAGREHSSMAAGP